MLTILHKRANAVRVTVFQAGVSLNLQIFKVLGIGVKDEIESLRRRDQGQSGVTKESPLSGFFLLFPRSFLNSGEPERASTLSQVTMFGKIDGDREVVKHILCPRVHFQLGLPTFLSRSCSSTTISFCGKFDGENRRLLRNVENVRDF